MRKMRPGEINSFIHRVVIGAGDSDIDCFNYARDLNAVRIAVAETIKKKGRGAFELALLDTAGEETIRLGPVEWVTLPPETLCQAVIKTWKNQINTKENAQANT